MAGSGEKADTRNTPRLESWVISVRPWRPHTLCTLLGEVTRTNLSWASNGRPIIKTKPHKTLFRNLRSAINNRPLQASGERLRRAPFGLNPTSESIVRMEIGGENKIFRPL